MARLILIKHAAPQRQEGVSPRGWMLSEAGHTQSEKLAELLRGESIERMFASDENKARETGEIVAAALGVPIESGADLHEHDRENVPAMATPDFISAMAQFFAERSRLALGRETALAAQQRIERAVQQIVDARADATVAVVTHGTVLSLLLAPMCGEDPFRLWRRMGLPSYAIVDWPARRVTKLVEKI